MTSPGLEQIDHTAALQLSVDSAQTLQVLPDEQTARDWLNISLETLETHASQAHEKFWTYIQSAKGWKPVKVILDLSDKPAAEQEFALELPDSDGGLITITIDDVPNRANFAIVEHFPDGKSEKPTNQNSFSYHIIPRHETNEARSISESILRDVRRAVAYGLADDETHFMKWKDAYDRKPLHPSDQEREAQQEKESAILNGKSPLELNGLWESAIATHSAEFTWDERAISTLRRVLGLEGYPEIDAQQIEQLTCRPNNALALYLNKIHLLGRSVAAMAQLSPVLQKIQINES